jgi:virulence-associated protein VagC
MAGPQPDRPQRLAPLGRLPYTVLPDVFVYDHAIDDRRATLALAEEGPPLLIAETLSPSTSRADLDLRHGKGYSYAQAGVREYLILDSTGEEIPEHIQGWRLEHGLYLLWRPDANGRWQSGVIPVAIAFEGVRVVVYASDGRRQLREGEVARTVSALEQRLSEQDVELARKDAELARRDEELAALRRLLEERDAGSSGGR